MTTTLSEVGSALLLAQGRIGITGEQLAASAGVPRHTVDLALRGGDVWLSTLLAVADQLNLDLVLVPKSISRGFANMDIRAPSASEPGEPSGPLTAVRAALAQVRAAAAKK